MVQVNIKADSKFPVDRKRVRSLVRRVLKDKGISSDAEVSIAIVGDRKMRQLNSTYKKRNETTDVLSFPYTETGGVGSEGAGFVTAEEVGLQLGDIVVSYPQAVKQAMEGNRLVDDKVGFLIEHGLNHLLGVHHK